MAGSRAACGALGITTFADYRAYLMARVVRPEMQNFIQFRSRQPDEGSSASPTTSIIPQHGGCALCQRRRPRSSTASGLGQPSCSTARSLTRIAVKILPHKEITTSDAS